MSDEQVPDVKRGKGGRWEKGKCPNPGGRPKNALSMVKVLREVLAEKVETKDEKKSKVTRAQILARAMVAEAAKGNAQLAIEIMKRVDGPSPNVIGIDDFSKLSNAELVARAKAAFGGDIAEGLDDSAEPTTSEIIQHID